MSHDFSAEEFSGQARLFPLPNVVLFPHATLPLFVFEPRYRQLLADAMAGDRLITLAMLKPGWEPCYDGTPEVQPIACLGRVSVHEPRADGCSSIVLTGLRRVWIGPEQPQPGRLFRMAQATLCQDDDSGDERRRKELMRGLLETVERLLTDVPYAHNLLSSVMASGLPLGLLTDVLAFRLQIPLGVKQQLLLERRTFTRAELLLAELKSTLGETEDNRPGREFPPAFSCN